jgi:hypothetical protein
LRTPTSARAPRRPIPCRSRRRPAMTSWRARSLSVTADVAFFSGADAAGYSEPGVAVNRLREDWQREPVTSVPLLDGFRAGWRRRRTRTEFDPVGKRCEASSLHCRSDMKTGDPEGIRDCRTDFPVDVPLPWANWPKHRVGRYLRPITRGVPPERWQELFARAQAGGSLHSLAREYGVSHESVRRVLKAAALQDY